MGTRRDFLKIAGVSVVARSTMPVESAAGPETANKGVVPPFQSPELLWLYETYTAAPTSIGADLTRMTVKAGADDPLIVAMGTDIAIFPGGGRPPAVQSFRLSTRGFKELAGIFHFGPALAPMVNMHALEPTNDVWRKDAERPVAAAQVTRSANSSTAGVTWTTNSFCQMILGASNLKPSLERMYIAPHAQSFTMKDPDDLDAVRALEAPLRSIWLHTPAIGNLAPTLFEGYPRYAPGSYEPPVIAKDTKELSEMLRILGPDDILTLTTRLRLALEDPPH